MAELRAYAVAAVEVRALAGADPEERGRLRELARRTWAAPRPRTRDLLGPMHRRVPGAPVIAADDPTPADLETLLAGSAVPPERGAATWRLVEALVAALARSSTRVTDARVPPGLLVPTGLPVPAVAGLVVGSCSPVRAAALTALHPWLGGFDGPEGWLATAARAGRPVPDVLVVAQG